MNIPWYYRVRPINWVMAKPWQIYPLWKKGWRYHVLYKSLRKYGDFFDPGPRGRLWSLWNAATFPHVHHESEDLH